MSFMMNLYLRKNNKLQQKLILIIFFTIPVTNCSTLSEINEKIKGDGVPYIPGV